MIAYINNISQEYVEGSIFNTYHYYFHQTIRFCLYFSCIQVVLKVKLLNLKKQVVIDMNTKTNLELNAKQRGEGKNERWRIRINH